jgi:prolyl oligopeptidase
MKNLLPVFLFSWLACTASKESGKEGGPIVTAPGPGLVSGDAGSPSASSPKWAYPPSHREKVEQDLFGEKVADPYRWLEDEKSPEVKQWMKAQDQLTRDYLSKIPGRDALAERFKQLLYIDSISAPVRRGKRFFYVRTHANKDKAILYWREGEKGEEKVLLDPNTWSESGEVSLGVWTPSWDGKKVAFNQRPNANDEAVMHVVDVRTGEWSKTDVIEGTKYGSAHWTPDDRSFYYTWLPTDPAISPANRPGYQEVRLHRLGSDPKSDAVVSPKTGDPTVFQSGGISRDGKYVFLVRARLAAESEIWIKRPKLGQDFKLIAKNKGAKYSFEYWKGQIYIATDEGAPNKRIYKVPAATPDRANWREIVPEEKSATLQNLSLVGGHLGLQYLKNAATELRVTTLEGKVVRTIPLPDIGSASGLHGLEDQDDAYFEFSSFTVPRQVYKTSTKSGAVNLWAKVDLPIDPAPYVAEQVWYSSRDGTRVSMFIVRRKDMQKDGSHPALLYGYGGFNIPSLPSFRATIYPWLEAGGVFALANLRGGGEYGEAWHQAGMRAKKQNVFDDFIAAGEYLVKHGYTQPEKLAIWGGSNGGLLVGAAMTQRPDLFGAVICSAPLLDMVRYHLSGGGKTWIPEYGNPDKPEDLKVLHAYSPYHHVNPGVNYPPLLMMSPAHDDRVDTMHARKFIAAVQNVTSKPALLRIETQAGHSGGDLVKKLVEYSADQFAFLFQVLGVKTPSSVGRPAATR